MSHLRLWPSSHGPQPAPKGSLERRAADTSPRAVGPSYAPRGSIPTPGSFSRLPVQHSIRPLQLPHPQPAPRGALGVRVRTAATSHTSGRSTRVLRSTGTASPVAVGGHGPERAGFVCSGIKWCSSTLFTARSHSTTAAARRPLPRGRLLTLARQHRYKDCCWHTAEPVLDTCQHRAKPVLARGCWHIHCLAVSFLYVHIHTAGTLFEAKVPFRLTSTCIDVYISVSSTHDTLMGSAVCPYCNFFHDQPRGIARGDLHEFARFTTIACQTQDAARVKLTMPRNAPRSTNWRRKAGRSASEAARRQRRRG